MKELNAALVPFVLYIALLGLALYGWVWNIVYIMQTDVINGMTIMRVIGVFVAPLGIILGYLPG